MELRLDVCFWRHEPDIGPSLTSSLYRTVTCGKRTCFPYSEDFPNKVRLANVDDKRARRAGMVPTMRG